MHVDGLHIFKRDYWQINDVKEAPFHSEADVDQKLLFSLTRATYCRSLSVTVAAAVNRIMLFKEKHKLYCTYCHVYVIRNV